MSPVGTRRLSAFRSHRGLEEFVSVLPVRLEVASLRPLVPGVDEEEAFLPRIVGFGALYRARQPVLVIFRCAVQTGRPDLPASRGIVPGRKYRAECIVCTVVASEIHF